MAKEQLKDITCNAQWTSDCCGKQDLDFDIITADTRYWPDFSVQCRIAFISNVTLSKSEIMEADSEEEAKMMARRWYNEHVIEAMEMALKIVKGEILVERRKED